MIAPFNYVFFSSSQKKLLDTGTGVLCYHYLGTAATKSNDPFLYVSPGRFREQLATLRDAGYSSGTLSELAAGTSGKKSIILTVDDGAKNFHEHGMAALADNGFKAIQFIVSGQIGGINEWDAKHGHPVVPLMDAGQIREWLAEGHEIGSHSMDHRNLSKLNEADARRQIIDSKKQLEDQFGVPIRHFSYPHGKFTPMTEELVKEAGYETACTTHFGVNAVDQNRHTLQRITPLSAPQLLGKVLHRLCREVKRRF